MKLSLYDDFRLGVWGRGDSLVDATALVDGATRPGDRMNVLIENWAELEPAVCRLATTVGVPLRSVTLRAAQPRPTKIVAAPVNHLAHQREMFEAGGFDGVPATIEKYVGFLKAPSSIVGPDEPIVLPFQDRRVDHEGELGIVIGQRARNVSRAAALSHVFGYVPLLDITLRGDEDRPYRKSFDSFTPLGPAIVTADEVGDPAQLDLCVSVNGDVRQQGSTSGLIYDVARLVEVYSAAMTLEPGDIIASGTLDGVSRLMPGDEITLVVGDMPPLVMAVQGMLSPTAAH